MNVFIHSECSNSVLPGKGVLPNTHIRNSNLQSCVLKKQSVPKQKRKNEIKQKKGPEIHKLIHTPYSLHFIVDVWSKLNCLLHSCTCMSIFYILVHNYITILVYYYTLSLLYDYITILVLYYYKMATYKETSRFAQSKSSNFLYSTVSYTEDNQKWFMDKIKKINIEIQTHFRKYK